MYLNNQISADASCLFISTNQMGSQYSCMQNMLSLINLNKIELKQNMISFSFDCNFTHKKNEFLIQIIFLSNPPAKTIK